MTLTRKKVLFVGGPGNISISTAHDLAIPELLKQNIAFWGECKKKGGKPYRGKI